MGTFRRFILLTLFMLLLVGVLQAQDDVPAVEATPDSATVTVITVPDANATTIGNVVLVAVAAISLVVSLISLVVTAVKTNNPRGLDAGVVHQIEMRQRDREALDRIEAAYQQAGTMQRDVVNILTSLLKTIAPLTPMKADDALAGLLADIQTPGVPTLPPAEAAG